MIKALPEPLMRGIKATFGKGLPGCALVGGTALSGFYACHRKSDDMDIFTRDAVAKSAAVAAVKSLTKIGAKFLSETQTPNYYHADIELGGHPFTADVVLDENLYRIGTFATTPSGILVADLETLLKMKIATLVSRCGEKDLYDLIWLTENYRSPPIHEWVALGHEVDGGVQAESMLTSLLGAHLRSSACGFSEAFGISAADAHRRILAFRVDLQAKLARHLEKMPMNAALTALVRKLKKIR